MINFEEKIPYVTYPVVLPGNMDLYDFISALPA